MISSFFLGELGDINAEIQDITPGTRRNIALSEINSILDTPQDVLESVGFNELLLREVRSFKEIIDVRNKAIFRLVNKITILYEQLDKETDPEKKSEIEKIIDEEKRNLRSLNSEEYDTISKN